MLQRIYPRSREHQNGLGHLLASGRLESAAAVHALPAGAAAAAGVRPGRAAEGERKRDRARGRAPPRTCSAPSLAGPTRSARRCRAPRCPVRRARSARLRCSATRTRSATSPGEPHMDRVVVCVPWMLLHTASHQAGPTPWHLIIVAGVLSKLCQALMMTSNMSRDLSRCSPL